MKTVGIVQARLGSSRLPRKMLLEVLGTPIIVHMLRRVARARRLHELWLATGDDAGNDPLAAAVERAGFRVFRGSESDVLDRFHQLALRSEADVVVRLTGDCPLHDPAIIDAVVAAFDARPDGVEYGSNVFPPTYPDGLDTEVFTRAALERTARESQNSMERENVTLGIHRQYHKTGPKPSVVNVVGSADFSHLRWTLDYEDDFVFVRRVYEALYPGQPDFGWLDVVALVTREPELLEHGRAHARNANVLAAIDAGGLERS